MFSFPPGGKEARGVLLAAQKPFPRGGFSGTHAPQASPGIGVADSQGIAYFADPRMDMFRLGPTVCFEVQGDLHSRQIDEGASIDVEMRAFCKKGLLLLSTAIDDMVYPRS